MASSMPDNRDNTISELETLVAELQDTIRSQRDTIDALQKTNQLLTEQLEETSKQLESSNEQFLSARGLFGDNDSVQRSLSIDENSSVDHLRKGSAYSIGSDNYSNLNATSTKIDEDDVYSSGDDVETYRTDIMDDHELLPLKQGKLKKKSEKLHQYNSRYILLYPSMLLYYDTSPIKADNRRQRKNSGLNKVIKSKGDANNDINHPKGAIFLRNYHVAIRKDSKKKRFDITFVPHESAISMGLAAADARIRFRCKTLNELKDWTDKIRTAITSANSGFIKYDVRTDYISNDLSNLGKITGKPEEPKSRKRKKGGQEEKKENEDENEKSKMFDINDLKQMMKREEELKNELETAKREIAKVKQEKEQIKTDLAIKTTEVESGERVAHRQKIDLEAKMTDIKAREETLKQEIAALRENIVKMEQKQRDQHKRIKRYKHHEEEIQQNIATIQEWNKKLSENSLQYLGSIYPNSSNKQLFESCQRGCVSLLEETYIAWNKINNRNLNVSDVSENDSDAKENMINNNVNGANNDKNGNKKKHKKKKESKIVKDMMLAFTEIYRKHLKTTINYASLQQAHNGVVNDFKILRDDFDNINEFDGNTLSDDALIMASMTASLF